MKLFNTAILLLSYSMITYSQPNYSGVYGYSLKPPGNTGNDKQATGPAGKLVLLKMEDNKYRFWLDVTIGWPTYNAGETDGTISFVNDTASFDNTFEDAEKPCILKFRVEGNTITINSLSTSFNCGFGNQVHADGEYPRLKAQPVLDNKWLKKEYSQAPLVTAKGEKAEIFQDENCLVPFSPKKYFIKGNSFLNIAETQKSMYTEDIPSPGKFTWGWIRKSDIKHGTDK